MTHTTEQRALLNAIIANPDDDAPRLIYAEFIRVQIQRAKTMVLPAT